VFEGLALGADGQAVGEVVFNTGMTGYQEVLTDRSYKGQIVAMTYPHIGNTGVTPEDEESEGPVVEGFIVREACPEPSNWRSAGSLEAYLRRHRVVGIQGIDTRALTRHIRDRGAQTGIISTLEEDPERLVAQARAAPTLVGRDLVQEVTCPAAYAWSEVPWVWGAAPPQPGGDPAQSAGPGLEPGAAARRQLDLFGAAREGPSSGPYRVVVFDCGIKRNILRQLVAAGCDPLVVPAGTRAAEVWRHHPEGILLSNGPGDPEGVPYLVDTVRDLLGRLPLFGICLGHQVLGLALGGRTFKLKFGHRGTNHPVQNLYTGRVEITTQNHGFAVDFAGFAGASGSAGVSGDLIQTHVSLNDGTCEGLAHRGLSAFSVQYHPEASPGPHDAHSHFRHFVGLMARERRARRPPRSRPQES
jgi:carbamoyl-phosphate synthase small subunit